MNTKKPPPPAIIIDTREVSNGRPLDFGDLPTEVVTLHTGDYSAVGLKGVFRVEWKTLGDLLTCIGQDRERFTKQISRLRAFPHRSLVVGCSYKHLTEGVETCGICKGVGRRLEISFSHLCQNCKASGVVPWRSELKPAHVLGFLAARQTQHRIPIAFVGDRARAAEWIVKLAEQSAREVCSRYRAATGILALTEQEKPDEETPVIRDAG